MEDIQHSDIEVRRARPGDEQAIAALLHDAFVGYKYLYTEKAFNSTILGIDKINERIHSKTMWVALFKGVIRATLSLTPEVDTLYVRSVGVSPIYRRNGLAKALMAHAEREGIRRGFQQLQLTTTPFLFEAIRLYKDFGFVECGFEDLFGTELIKMKKNLNPTFEKHTASNIEYGTGHSD